MKQIGIDLGSFNSSGVVRMDDEGRMLHIVHSGLDEGPQGKSHPSFVKFNANGTTQYVGHDAKKYLLTSPEYVIWGTKRLIGLTYSEAKTRGELRHFQYRIRAGENDEILIDIGVDRATGGPAATYTPVDIARMIIEAIKTDAEDETINPEVNGERLRRAVVSFPAYFNPVRVGHIERAVRGTKECPLFDEVRTIPEPLAGALSMGVQLNRDCTIIVLDLGAGTFDVTVAQVRLVDGKPKLAARGTSGHEALGGMDMDRDLYNALMKDSKFVASHGNFPEAALFRWIEAAKIDLSYREETTIEGKPAYVMTRNVLEHAIGPCLAKIGKPIRIALEQAEMKASKLDYIVFVGGPTHMPCVRKTVFNELAALGASQELLGQIGLESPPVVDPMTCVAQGAALLVDDNVIQRPPYGIGAWTQGEYDEFIPMQSDPLKITKRYSHLVKRPRRLATIDIVTKIPNSDNDTSAGFEYRYERIGTFPLYLNPEFPADFDVILTLSDRGSLTIGLSQVGNPSVNVVYTSTELLMQGEVDQRFAAAERARRLTGPEIEKLNAAEAQNEVSPTNWSQADLVRLQEIAEQALDVARGVKDPNDELSSLADTVEKALQSVTASGQNTSINVGATRAANVLSTLIHLVMTLLPDCRTNCERLDQKLQALARAA
jgi:hypothetical protein